jgi:nucleotide-binding universal stress UspA family protein
MDVQKAHRPVVVGVDGSKAAERAVRWAALEARRRHVPVRVVQAAGWVPPLHQYTDRSFGPDPRVALVGAARADVAAAAKVAATAAPGVVVEQQVLDGFPVPLVAVYAWRDLLLDPGLASHDWAVVEQQGRAELAERLAGWSGKYPDVPVRRVVVRDAPARALVEQSVTAQLLVVGSHGRGGVGALLLGSVSHAVLHRSHCPVMIVRA